MTATDTTIKHKLLITAFKALHDQALALPISAALSGTALPLSLLTAAAAAFLLQFTYTKLAPTPGPLHQLALLPGELFPQIHRGLPPSGHLDLSPVTISLRPLPSSLPLLNHSTLFYCLHGIYHYLKLS